MSLDEEIRKLARSNYWQSMYAISKNRNIQMFSNVHDLSGPQITMMQWLQIYDVLYLELAQKETVLLTQNVINDNDRCNAYLHIRRMKQEEEMFKLKQDSKISKAKSKHKFKKNGNVNVIDVDLGR